MDDQTRQATRQWTLAQPVVSAFVTSVVRDFRDRDDVLQDVAVAVVESIGRWDPERPFVAWAIGIARNQLGLYDLFPTFCEWAGIATDKLPKNIEGGSIAALLSNNGQGAVKRARDDLVFHFPHYQSGDDGPHSAIFRGDLKLMIFYEDDRLALFDLSKDLSEQHDLSKQMPAETEQLHERLKKYLADVDAQFATPNPDYDPSASPEPRKGGKGGMKKGGGDKPKGRNKGQDTKGDA